MARAAAAEHEERSPSSAASEDASHSGRLLLRMPPSLHAELARAAEEEGVSLNAFITSALSGAVRWRTSGSAADAPAQPSARRSRLLIAALAVDVVLVALAGVLAIALLIVAFP